MDAVDQAALVHDREVTPLELLDAAIERIERFDPVLNAVVIRWFDHARDTARADLPAGPFRGVPFLIKDLYATYAGQTISNGNQALKNEKLISPADTTLVSRYRAAGLVTAGRTHSPGLQARGRRPRSQVGWCGERMPAMAAAPSAFPLRVADWSASSPPRAGSR